MTEPVHTLNVIGRINLYGDWTIPKRANPAEGADEVGLQVIDFVTGKTDKCTPEMALRFREIIAAQGMYAKRLESGLRRAAADLQSAAAAEIAPLDLPADVAGLVATQRNEARYEMAMYAAQRFIDVVNEALGES